MRINKALDNFRNVREYIFLLPINEQISEIDKMIEYHSIYKHPRVSIKHKYALVNQFKDFKKALIQYHMQQLIENPLIIKNTQPLYQLIKKN